MGQLAVPVGGERLQLLGAHRRRVLIGVQQGSAVPVGFLPQKEGDGPALPRLQRHNSGQSPAAVAVVVEFSAQVAPLHAHRIAIAPVRA